MKSVKDIEKHLVLKKVIQQVFCGLCPAFLGVVLSSSMAKTWILTNSPLFLKNLFCNGKFQLIIILVVCIAIPCIIIASIESSSFKKNKSGYDILLNLLNDIDDVVDEKRDRFKRVREEMPKSDATIFKSITKPLEQIAKQSKALCDVMRYMTNDLLKSTTFYVNGNNIVRSLAVIGEGDIKPDINELNSKSIAREVIDSGKCILENNIEKAKHDFYAPKGSTIKSIFVYPVFEGKDIRFLLCFTSKNKDAFNNKDIDKYTTVISEFTKRMLLEWHLFHLVTHNNLESNEQSQEETPLPAQS